MKQITAMSVIQPWGELLMEGQKTIENRSWKTSKRGFMAIHASKSKNKRRFDLCRDEYLIEVDPDEVTYGAIIGFAELIDIVDETTVPKKQRKWLEEDQYGFVFTNMMRLDEPVAVTGHMGLWSLKGKELLLCLDQLSRKEIKMLNDRLLN